MTGMDSRSEPRPPGFNADETTLPAFLDHLRDAVAGVTICASRWTVEQGAVDVAWEAWRLHHPWMDDTPNMFPTALPALRVAAREAGFTMSCEERTGSLLAVLAAARPGAAFSNSARVWAKARLGS
ncbi:hypothetical protein [Streptomyces lutosisoli]|uniref:Uncharacterized protein n=1 Tax=Streptomyces lutosisoli TaxID=2665721 RepID=A0ABW2VYM0_9ACTN